jgi:uncharacterized membrane protein YkgB
MNTETRSQNHAALRLTALSEILIRYSVVVVLGWIGAMKFTGFEAGAIEGLVASSPFTAWLYGVLSVQATSNLIGVIEIATAALLIAGAWSARAAVAGAAAAAFTFLLTSSFLLTAPVWETSLGGFPALSVTPGQFLLKDLVLLAAAVFLLGRALERTQD